jgi:hypothetical protein
VKAHPRRLSSASSRLVGSAGIGGKQERAEHRWVLLQFVQGASVPGDHQDARFASGKQECAAGV